MTHSLRTRTWEVLEVAGEGDRLSRACDIFILSLIFLNVLAVIVGTVPSVEQRHGAALWWFEVVSVIVFTAEYLARLWSCVTAERYAAPVRGRLRLALTPMALIDLAAILPFYLPLLGVDLRFIRVLRLLRVFRIGKLGRYSTAVQMVGEVVRDKREELVLTACLMAMLLVLSASTMYYCENAAQPASFPSIPATLWWAVTTLTTVGYGDVVPVTTIGRTVAALIALLGIAMFALPTAILGSGFAEHFQRRRAPVCCPHCGRELT